MSLSCLKITDFRNLQAIDIQLSPSFNYVYGANGSGKTSLLEAIYFLTHGRSFRTTTINRIIRNDAAACTLFGSFMDQNGNSIAAGIERQRNGNALIKVNGHIEPTIVNLINIQPVLLINPFTFQLLDAGPLYRRQFIDWGVFHVEHNFILAWRKCLRALKQRNAALKTVTNKEEAKIWDPEFVAASLVLHQFRKAYIEQLAVIFFEIVTKLLAYPDLTLSYVAGWDEQLDLQEVLNKSFSRDCVLGYTQYGPQKADLQIRYKNTPAVEVLSRGEQKLLVYALKLAQGILLQENANKNCLYLIDDLAAELDEANHKTLFQELIKLQAQVVITSVSNPASNAALPQNALFAITQGNIVNL